MAEKFDCCSHYLQCSEQGTCLFSSDDEYAGCGYKKKLTSGVNYYVKNVAPSLRWQPDPVIYLDCYHRHFKVSRLGHNGFSYPLSQEEFDHPPVW